MKGYAIYEKEPLMVKNSCVDYTVYVQKTNLIPHWHEHIELLFFHQDGCLVTCNGKTFPVTKGDLVVVNSTEIHSHVLQDHVDSVEYICMLIPPVFFNGIDYASISIQNHIKNDAYVAEFMEYIGLEYQQKTEDSHLMVNSYTYALYVYLMRNYPVTRISEEELNIRIKNLKRLDTVFTYIAKNYNKKISTSALAKLCYLNESYFCRLFKEATGKTVMQYVNEYRIERASLILENTSDSIADIASAVGFEDANYFTRVFKSLKKQTPVEYRNKAKH